MIRYRSDEQVLASAEQIDALLNAGIERDVVQQLVALRSAWQRTGILRRIALTDTLITAVADPVVQQWDGVFTAAARRSLNHRQPHRA